MYSHSLLKIFFLFLLSMVANNLNISNKLLHLVYDMLKLI